MAPAGEETTGRLAVGQLIGRNYRVLRPLAKGGMGAVYEVEQQVTGARRALKVMHHRLARDPEFRARFEQEARVSATIRSEHVVEVIDAGVDEESGLLFIVMELLEGVTLSDEMRRRQCFDWPEVLEIFRQLCHALARAHSVGVVHLDLKPANIFLARTRTAGGTYIVKVLDFGIARFESSPAGLSGGIGTPGWMAPEQTKVGDIQASADVWALGLLAFYLATGRGYWLQSGSAATAAVIQEANLSEVVPASDRARQLGVGERLFDGFDGWFARCMKRDPLGRFADAAAALQALEQALGAEVAGAAPVSLVAAAHLSGRDSVPPPAAAFAETRPAGQAGGSVDVQTVAGRPSVRKPPVVGPTLPSAVSVKTASSRTVPAVAIGLAALAVGGGFTLAVLRKPLPPAAPTATPGVAAPAPPLPAPVPLLRIHGANTLGADLVPALVQAFLKKRTGARRVVARSTGEDEMLLEARDEGSSPPLASIEVHAHTAASGFQDLGKGAADLAMASRRITRDEVAALGALGSLSAAASEQVIALDGVAVVVNPENPVSSLKTDDLAKLLAGDRTDWQDVGGRRGPVHVVAPADGSGTWDFISSFLLRDRPLTPSAVRQESAVKLSDAVAADPSAIGLVGQGFVRKAKVLAVQEGTHLPLIPSPATVSTEDYPFSRRLYLYTPASAPTVAHEFVDFATSDEAQPIVAASGFVALAPSCDPRAAACPSCTASYRAAVVGACRVTFDLRYDPRTGELDSRALRDLDRLVRLLGAPENAAKSVLLFAFATGDPKTGLPRSQADADAVASQLRARSLTVATARGLGVLSPSTAASEEEVARRDRRIEVWLR